MKLDRFTGALDRGMNRFGFCALFGLLSGVSIGEFRGGEWTNGIVSSLMAIVTAVAWDMRRSVLRHREFIERQRQILTSVFEDICHVRDEMVARSGQERPKG